MIVYLYVLSIGGAFFSLSIYRAFVGRISASQISYSISSYHDSLSNTRDLWAIIVRVFLFLADFFSDSAKYIVVAVIISLISIFVYFWMLVRPERWKSYAMLIIGIAYIWVGGAPPEFLSKALEGDTSSIVTTTLLVIGHLYVLTTVVQFIWGVKDLRYFNDVRQEIYG